MKGKVFKKIRLAIGSIVCILAIGTSLLYKGHIRFNYPSFENFPIQGIDVSHHQGEIDWSEVKQQSIRFAFIKATEGGNFKDKKFQLNWTNAQSVGIDVGAYHFFTFCKTGKEQAINFIETVPKNDTALPPVVDLEFGGNCNLQVDDSTVLSEIQSFLNEVESHYGKKVILYVTHEFYDHFMNDQFLGNPIWIRDIYQQPVLPKQRKWLIWQFANRGHLQGIETYVDLNVFNGNEELYNGLKRSRQ